MNDKLPAELFVHRAPGGTEGTHLQPVLSLKDIECTNTRVRVGVYKLVKEVEVISEPTIVAEVG
ncbi:MAG TPA: hypothetical protein VNT99_08345 [Methylomirabilota bacterium]|nr:hypothetical protein [Methylomirabilota bacterium]